jgi:hypothetical protein
VQGVGNTLKYSINPSGVLNYHNTYLSENNRTGYSSNSHFRNNLLISHGDKGPSFSVETYTNYSTSDYNGFRSGPGVAEPFAWNSPAFGTRADYGKLVERSYKSLKAYSAATGQDRHSVMVDYDSFVRASPPDENDPSRLYFIKDYDLRLRPKSRAVDAGVPLANVNDGFTGRAPDLGAYEVGVALPHYGPRP